MHANDNALAINSTFETVNYWCERLGLRRICREDGSDSEPVEDTYQLGPMGGFQRNFLLLGHERKTRISANGKGPF